MQGKKKHGKNKQDYYLIFLILSINFLICQKIKTPEKRQKALLSISFVFGHEAQLPILWLRELHLSYRSTGVIKFDVRLIGEQGAIKIKQSNRVGASPSPLCYCIACLSLSFL